MRKIHIGLAIVLVSILSATLVIGASFNQSKPAPPDLAQKLTALARGAYALQMDATLTSNRARLNQLSGQLADYYSSVPGTAIDSARLPANRNLTAQEAANQQAKLEATLKEKGIDVQQNAAFQAAQRQANAFRQLPAVERVRSNIQDGIRSFNDSNMTIEAWGLDDFKVVSVQTQGSTATLVADMHVWSRFRHIGPDGKAVVDEPHNGLHYTFYFQQEGASWKIIDWEFEFLPGEAP